MGKKLENKFKVLRHRYLAGGYFFLFFFTLISIKASSSSPGFSKNDSLEVIQLFKEGTQARLAGDFEEATKKFQSVVTLSQKVLSDRNPNLYSFILSLGSSYKNLGEYDKAVDSYLDAEKSLVRLYSHNNPRLGYVYFNLGIIYKLKGDFVKNYDFQKAALRAFSSDSVRYKSQYNSAKYGVSEALFYLHKYRESINSCKANMSNVDDDIKNYYYSLLAHIYDELGRYDLTKKYYQRTFYVLKNLSGDDSFDLGLEYTDYATFLLKIHDFDESFKYNELSEKIIERYFTAKSVQYSYVMLNFADYYFDRSSEASGLEDFHEKRKNDLSVALEYYQRALIAGSVKFNQLDLAENPGLSEAVSEIQILDILKKKAHCLETLGDLDLAGSNKNEAIGSYKLALRTITQATELVHQIRSGYVSEDSRLFLAENQESTFVEAVNISYKLYQQTNDDSYARKGFEFTEKSKSASFLAAVKDSRAKEFGGIPDSLLKKEDYLKINISNYKEMLFEERQNDKPDSARISLFTSKIFHLNEQYDQLVQLFEKSYPRYYAFKYKDEVVGVEDVRSDMSSREAVVEYMIDEPTSERKKGQLFKFVITNDDLIFRRETIDSTFINDIESVYQFLTSNKYLFTGLKDFKNYSTSAYRLYHVLLQDEKSSLEGKELVVIPDDKLDYIPFDALLSQMPDTTKMNFRTLPYLVKDYSISYTYSATLLFDYFEKDKVAKKDLLAFAPSYEGDTRDYTASAEFRSGLLPLPAVSKEVDFIHKYISGDVFKDSLAQEDRFKKLAPNYDILHLAMHTIINDTLPMYSKLAFSKPYKGEKDDGWLNTSEIYTMNLKARMAVLSACNTGSGKLQKGEGVMSLARGFLYAGCPSIVMTLWEVEDESGAHIMKDFYRFLSKGKSKTEALREAKLEHIRNADPLKAHPHYWLGYVVVGNPDPLYASKDIYFVLVLLGIVVLLIVDQLYRKKKARD